MITQKNIIHYLNSDIFTNIQSIMKSNSSDLTIIVPHVCNNINLFGAGFAGAIANKFPIVKENFHMLGNKSKLGYVQYIQASNNNKLHKQIVFANMIAQDGVMNHNNPRPLNYEYLMKCMINVRDYLNQIKSQYEHKIEIHAPKFGCGLAGGKWDMVSLLIQDIWNKEDTFIYNYKK
jgi:hypothetical protein